MQQALLRKPLKRSLPTAYRSAPIAESTIYAVSSPTGEFAAQQPLLHVLIFNTALARRLLRILQMLSWPTQYTPISLVTLQHLKGTAGHFQTSRPRLRRLATLVSIRSRRMIPFNVSSFAMLNPLATASISTWSATPVLIQPLISARTHRALPTSSARCGVLRSPLRLPQTGASGASSSRSSSQAHTVSSHL